MTDTAEKVAMVGQVYREMILRAMPEGWERDAAVADLDDVISLVDEKMAQAAPPPPPAKPKRQPPPVEAARISNDDARAAASGKPVLGFTPLS